MKTWPLPTCINTIHQWKYKNASRETLDNYWVMSVTMTEIHVKLGGIHIYYNLDHTNHLVSGICFIALFEDFNYLTFVLRSLFTRMQLSVTPLIIPQAADNARKGTRKVSFLSMSLCGSLAMISNDSGAVFSYKLRYIVGF